MPSYSRPPLVYDDRLHAPYLFGDLVVLSKPIYPLLRDQECRQPGQAENAADWLQHD